MSGVIGALIGSFVKPPFAATGGNETLTQNGWRYHIFNSSGTFTVSSGESTLQILTINGGSSGVIGSESGTQIIGGAGGAGGSLSFGPTTSAVSSSFAVTVGGAGGASSVAPVRNVTTVNGGTGGPGGRVSATFYPSVINNASLGQSVPLINTRGTPWSLLSLNQATNAGGGGGGSYVVDYGCGSGSAQSSPANGGAGGYNTTILGAGGAFVTEGQQFQGSPAPANSGGGGGGGSASSTLYCDYIGGLSATQGGLGGSGIVIVAYPVA